MLINDQIWLFAGRFGAGKSTFSRLWENRDDGHAINDDRILICSDDHGQGFVAYSFPWIGEDRIIVKTSAPLAGLCFLQQSDDSSTNSLTPQQAFSQLVQVATIPWHEKKLIGSALGFCDRLLSKVPADKLRFRPDQTAVDAVFDLVS